MSENNHPFISIWHKTCLDIRNIAGFDQAEYDTEIEILRQALDEQTAEKEKVLELIRQFPHSPKTVLQEIAKKFGKSMNPRTLRRLAKKAGLRWKRMRKSLKSKRDEKAFRSAQKEIDVLIAQDKAGELDLFYFDEAGFSLTPTVPYGWQPLGERIEIPSGRSKQLNVLGFLGREENFYPYTVEGSVDSSCVIACLDDFCKSRTQRTVVIIDNASIHHSKDFEARKAVWEDQNVFLYFLPPYSPELNLIEMLWGMIKYHWLPIAAYESYETLVQHVESIITQIGSKFRFACTK